MIGKVTWKDRDGDEQVAILNDDGTWTVPGDETFAQLLGAVYSPLDYAPADGPYGAKFLEDWARHTGGTVAFEPKTPPPPDAIF